MYFFTCITLVLYLFESPVLVRSQLFCSTNKTVQITSDDILSFSVQHGGSSNFDDLISASIDDSYGHFIASSVPNEGYFIFNDNYVLTGFTTQGEDTIFYVSEFSIEIVSNNSNYKNYTKIYSVDSYDEVYFPLDPLTPTHEIHFNVLDKASSYSNYYWKIGLFGCKEEDAYTVATCGVVSPSMMSAAVSSSVPPSPPGSMATSSSIPHQGPSSSDRTITITSIIVQTTVVRVSNICSSSVTMVPERSSLAAVSVVNKNVGAAVAGVAVPLLLVIIVLVVLLVVVLAWIYKRKVWAIPLEDSSRPRNNTFTLKEIKNIPLYSNETTNSTEVTSANRNSTAEYNMVNNEMYGDSTVSYEPLSDQTEVKAVNPFSPSDDNVYSAIDNDEDNVYTDPDADKGSSTLPATTPSNTYECVGTTDHTSPDDITPTTNPSYALPNTSIQ